MGDEVIKSAVYLIGLNLNCRSILVQWLTEFTTIFIEFIVEFAIIRECIC